MNGEEKFPELYFREWPIETASIEEPVEVWADRVTAHQQITNILEYLVLSTFLCKIIIGQFFKERQIPTHFSHRV